MYWAPCLDPYIDDPTNHATTCHNSTQFGTLVPPASAAPILSQNPTTTAPSALFGALNSKLIVAGAPQGVQLKP